MQYICKKCNNWTLTMKIIIEQMMLGWICCGVAKAVLSDAVTQ